MLYCQEEGESCFRGYMLNILVDTTVIFFMKGTQPFQIMSNQLNLPQVDSNIAEETSQG